MYSSATISFPSKHSGAVESAPDRMAVMNGLDDALDKLPDHWWLLRSSFTSKVCICFSQTPSSSPSAHPSHISPLPLMNHVRCPYHSWKSMGPFWGMNALFQTSGRNLLYHVTPHCQRVNLLKLGADWGHSEKTNECTKPRERCSIMQIPVRFLKICISEVTWVSHPKELWVNVW